MKPPPFHAPWLAHPIAEGDSVRRVVTYQDLVDKAKWLDAAASLDARHPGIRELAVRYQKAYSANNPGGTARALHAFVRDSVNYCFGPSFQEFADSWTILNRPGGSCDNCAGKSRLFVALCRAVELDAQIVPNFRAADDFNHVQARVRWQGSEREPMADAEGWLRAELIVKGVPLGYGPNVGTRIGGRLQLT